MMRARASRRCGGHDESVMSMSERKTGGRMSAGGNPGDAATPQQELTKLVAAYGRGQFDAVIDGARRFTGRWPGPVVGWNLLAEGLRMTGRLEEAESACRQALQVDPDSAEAHNNAGNVFRDRGDPAAAEAAYRRALALKPGLVEARYNLGNVLRATGRLPESVAAYREAIARRPGEFLYHTALGAALKEAGELEDARAAFEQALSLRPDHARTHNDLGNVLRDLGAYDESRRAFERAIELEPRLVETHNNLGNLLKATGEAEAAQDGFRRALALDPGHTSAWYNLAMTKRFAAGDPDLDALAEQLARDDLDEAARIRLHFALGKALADAGADADRVFAHYLEGCRRKRATLDYDPTRNEHWFARIADCCTAEWLQALPETGDPTEAPVFVVGMPRSGTTLVEQILASHPRVEGVGERRDLGRLVASKNEAAGRDYPEWVVDMPAAELSLLGVHYRQRVIDPVAAATRVVDKMPSNFLYLGLVAAALPGARIVHMRRDPLDTCLSCFMQLFSGWQPFSYDLAELGRYYRAYAGLMEHWRSVLPAGRMLEFDYEALVADPEPQIRRLLAHCGLDWDPACLAFHEQRRAVVTASVMQVRQPLYGGSVGRWRRYRDHLQPLIEALGPLAPTEATGSG